MAMDSFGSGVERVELAKKASAVAVSVGACPRIDVPLSLIHI